MKFVGPVDVRSHNTPSRAVILYRPFLSLINGSRNVYDDFGAMTSSLGATILNLDGHSFHPLLIRYPRWTRNCVTRLTLI